MTPESRLAGELARKVHQVCSAERLFKGIVLLDPSILATNEGINKARNFAREEYGLPPDNAYGGNPEVVREMFRQRGVNI